MQKKKIAVLGGAISGCGSAILAAQKGFEVFLSDAGRIADKYRQMLESHDIPYEEGGHTPELILDASEVVKSPGIPDTAPMVQLIREKGIPVISEIEFAGRYIDGAKTVCITGSNGKTTTTSLIYAIMRDAGVNVALGGNIGESFALSAARGGYDMYVLEISSFQLDGMYDFRADVAVLMNITPDHLDRYDHCFQNYVDSKMRITRNQGAGCSFVYSADDEVIAAELARCSGGMSRLPFTLAKADGAPGAGMGENGVFIAKAGGRSVEIDTSKMQLKGPHNTYNAMAAALAALAAGIDEHSIRESIYRFAPVEHRLEPVCEIDGVVWINDSKATNVDSVKYALQSMTRPTVWIAGGTDKGNDYQPLKELAAAKVHTLVCMGVDNRKLVESFTGVVPAVVDTSSLDQAMKAARAAARSGDAVLLSPACASFDLFKNYEHRGQMFKQWLAQQQNDDGPNG
ncbi:MAG: UDP-N-acetylmuramoyl-L-alanine--D-glutamate ligase [Alistipes sp.]|nr:UDP-N-acetylmuramoyl-L-alanine--D-glutamate ligase [Alistipes sp.]